MVAGDDGFPRKNYATDTYTGGGRGRGSWVGGFPVILMLRVDVKGEGDLKNRYKKYRPAIVIYRGNKKKPEEDGSKKVTQADHRSFIPYRW